MRGGWLALTMAGALLLQACGAAPDQPRRTIDPGDVYWAHLECTIGAAMAVPGSPPGGAEGAGASPGQGHEPADIPLRDSRAHAARLDELDPAQEEVVRDCLRERGYRWYWERLQQLR